MDCLICYKLVFGEVDNSYILSNSRIFAGIICKLLDIPKNNVREIDLADSILCKNCQNKLEELKELEEKIEELRLEIRKDMTQSKDISETLQNVYGGPMSKTSQIRMKLFQAIQQNGNSPDFNKIEASVSTVDLDIEVDEIIPSPIQEIVDIYSSNDENEMSNSSEYSCSDISGARSKSWISKHMGKKKKKNFKCKDCERPHPSNEELQSHLESALISNEIHKCQFCSEEFWGSQCLDYHHTNNHPWEELDGNCEERAHRKSNSNSKIWKCSVCGRKYIHKHNLKRHGLIHGPKKFKCPFEKCGMRFHRKDHLKKHLKNPRYPTHHRHRHPNKKSKVIKCPYCSKYFLLHSQLINHLRDKKHVICGICQESFISNGCLNHHRSISHGIIRGRPKSTSNKRGYGSFVCMQCKKRFLSKFSLKLHQITHGPRKFKCPINGCGKLFKTNLNLKSHLIFFHEKRRDFKCQFQGCGKMLSSKINFVNHQKRHKK